MIGNGSLRRVLVLLLLMFSLLPSIVAAQTRLTPLSAIGHSAGSAAGLLAGAAAGTWASGHFSWDCCSEDPGLAAGMAGAAVGSVLGTAIGGELAVRATKARSAGFGQRVIGSMAGMLGGIALASIVGKVTDHGSSTVLIASYSVGQGLLAALVTQAEPVGARYRVERVERVESREP